MPQMVLGRSCCGTDGARWALLRRGKQDKRARLIKRIGCRHKKPDASSMKPSGGCCCSARKALPTVDSRRCLRRYDKTQARRHHHHTLVARAVARPLGTSTAYRTFDAGEYCLASGGSRGYRDRVFTTRWDSRRGARRNRQGRADRRRNRSKRLARQGHPRQRTAEARDNEVAAVAKTAHRNRRRSHPMIGHDLHPAHLSWYPRPWKD